MTLQYIDTHIGIVDREYKIVFHLLLLSDNVSDKDIKVVPSKQNTWVYTCLYCLLVNASKKRCFTSRH